MPPSPPKQQYSQSNEEEPYYILKTNNPFLFWVPDGYDPDHFMPWVGKCESFYETDQNNIEWCAQIVHAENTEPSIQNQHPEYLEDLFSRSAVNLDETERQELLTKYRFGTT